MPGVKDIIKELTACDEKLGAAIKKQDDFEKAVESAAEGIVESQVNSLLSTVSVEELNRDKQGIRVQLLTQNGINTVADVLSVSKSRIVAINGIGENGAKTIIAAAKKIRQAAKKGVSVKLSADSNDAVSLAMIVNLYKLKRFKPIGDRAELIYGASHGIIEANVPLVKTGISRMFSSSGNKEKSDNAIVALTQLYDGLYRTHVSECLAADRGGIESNYAVQNAALADFRANPADYYSLLDSVCGIRVTTGTETQLDESMQQEIEDVEVDTSLLNVTLRKYQHFGVQYILNRKCVLLGDEMGLGKTIEAIAAIASLAANGEYHFIVVCPAAVLSNWCREIEKHSDLQAFKLHSDDREKNNNDWIENGGVAVTTYETASKIRIPEHLKLGMLVVDEAHYIKNPDAQRTKAVLEIRKRTGRVLFMTGTPMENKLDEMCFLIKCLQPETAAEVNSMKAVSGSDGFKKAVAPVYIRRTRLAVLKELPDLVESEEWCSMGKTEKSLYAEAVGEKNFMAMRQVSWNTPDLEESSKYQRLNSILENAREQGRKVIVFSFFLNTISKLQGALGENVYGPINGSITPEERQQIVDEFSAHEGFAVLLSQIQAGGTGLNIQAASVIVITEPQLKPSIENQAIARAYRMGQLNSVLVYRLLCEDSADARILKILKEKQGIFDDYADKSVSGDETLKEAELAEIMEQEAARLAETA